MSLRARIFLASGLLVLVPLLLLGLGIRREMSHRLTEQYTRRAESLIAVIEEDLGREGEGIRRRLEALRFEIAADNRFRRAALDADPGERRTLLDYASGAMALTGLSMLQVQDSEGRIVSSGHFRNEYDRLEPDLPRLLAEAPGGAALVRARRPAGSFLALARVDSVTLGGRRFTLVGGVEMDSVSLARLARDTLLAVSLLGAGEGEASPTDSAAAGLPAGEGTHGFLVRSLELPFVRMRDAGNGDAAGARGARLERARLVVRHSSAPLEGVLASLDRWLLLALLAAAAGALLLATVLSSGISRPIRALAGQTAAIDLDRLDADFASDRRDEVGTLSRFLGAMTERLRRSVEDLRVAERRAALGEMARQVNHDLRNGVGPIRNVLRHLGRVAREEPSALAPVFVERQETLEKSLAYLEDLAAGYARLTPEPRRERVSVNEIVRLAVPAGLGDARVAIATRLAGDLPVVVADPTGLRRIVENLVRNARESLGEAAGSVTISTLAERDDAGTARVVLRVEDTGRGMSREEQDHMFEHFYTTRPGGTGLGLSIVRRLVADFEGSLRVESEPGRGTRVIVSFPAAGGGESAA